MHSLSIYPLTSGDLFEHNGRTLVAIAPCCPVYHRRIKYKSGIVDKKVVPAKFWEKVSLLSEQAFDISSYRHLPVFKWYPTWVVREYGGGDPLDCVWQGKGSELTLWWCKHRPDALNYRPLLLAVPSQLQTHQPRKVA